MITLTSSGHLTATNRRSIQAIIDAGLLAGRVGRTTYRLEATDNANEYRVSISSMETDMFSRLREETHNHTATVTPTRQKAPTLYTV